MAHFRYMGDPLHAGEGPATVVAYGHTFAKGEPVEVSDKDIVAKLAGNSHFEAADAPAPAKAAKASGEKG